MPAPPWPLRQKILIWSTKLLFSKMFNLHHGISMQPWLQIYLHQNFYMKYLVILLMLPLLSSTDCSPKHKLPACLTKMLDERMKGDGRSAPLEVTEYDYNGKVVYLFTMPCCDQSNDVYDRDCNRICAPS